MDGLAINRGQHYEQELFGFATDSSTYSIPVSRPHVVVWGHRMTVSWWDTAPMATSTVSHIAFPSR